MTRLFEQGLMVEFAHEAAAILPAGIVVSGRIEDEMPQLEIAIEDSLPASSIQVTNLAGASLGEIPLNRRNTPLGDIHYGEMTLPLNVPSVLRVFVKDELGEILPRYSFGLDAAQGRAFPWPVFEGTLDPDDATQDFLLSHGPRGTQRCAGAVNVLSIHSGEAGIRVELILDDGGAARRIEVTMLGLVRSGDQPPMAVPIATAGADLERTDQFLRIPIVAGLGTYRTEFRFLDGSGEDLPGFACTLDLVDVTLCSPETARLLSQPGTTDAATAPELEDGEEATGRDRPARPATSHGSLNLLSEFESFVQRSLRDAKPARWPDVIGDVGKEIGPEGLLTGKKALRIQSIEVRDGVLEVILILDDGGFAHHVVAARDALVISEAPVIRGTDFATGVVHLMVPADVKEPIVLVRDRFEAAIPNLSARLDLDAGEFQPEVLPSDTWYPKFHFRDPLDLAVFFCAVCRVPVRQADSFLLTELDYNIRKLIRKKRALSADLRGVCDRCLRRLENELPGWDGRWKWIAPPRVGWVFSKVIMAGLGSHFPATAPGMALVAWLGPDGRNLMDLHVALFAVAALGGALLASLPYNIFIRPLQRVVESFLSSKREMPPLEALALPLATLGGLWYFWTLEKPFSGPLRDTFRDETLPLAGSFALGAGVLLAILGQYLSRLAILENLEEEERLKRTGEIYEQANQVLRSRNGKEFDLLLQHFVTDGLKAAVFQIFHYDPRAHRFVPIHTRGLTSGRAPINSFDLGDPNLPAKAATLGRPLSMQNLEWDKGVTDKELQDRSSLICIPYGRVGRIEGVINIMAFRDAYSMACLSTILRGVSTVLNSAYDGAHQPRRRTDPRKRDEVERPRRESLVDSFGAYFPPDFITRAEEDPALLSLEGEKAQITYMVVEFPNFREVSASWPARQMVSVLSSLHARLVPRIVKQGGFIEGFQEGRMRVLFGRPQNLPDYTLHAVKVACDLAMMIPVVCGELGIDEEHGLHHRLGLATGDAIIGNIGTLERFQYAVTGPAVDVALCMAAAAEYYDVMIVACPRTIELTRRHLQVRQLDQVLFREAGEPWTLTQIVGSVGEPSRTVNKEALHLYQKALLLYREHKYDQAAGQLQSALAIAPGDRPSALLQERCRRLQSAPTEAAGALQRLDLPGVRPI